MSILLQHIKNATRLILILLLQFAFSSQGNASTSGSSIDRYYQVYNESRGNRRVQMANELMQALKAEDFIDTLYHFSNTETTRMQSYVYNSMCWYYYSMSMYSQALETGEKALEVSRHLNEPEFSSDLNNLLGITHVRLGNYADALAFFEKAYEIDLKLKDEDRLSSDLNSQSSVYLSINQPEQGIECINQAIDIEHRLGHDDCLAIRLGMASELYMAVNNPKVALKLAREAYDLDRKAGRAVKAAIRRSQQAAALIALDSIDAARENLLSAVKVLSDAGEKNSLAICYNQLGELSLKTDNKTDAEQYFNKVIALCAETANRAVERKAERGLWQVLRTTNKAAALQHLERYNALNDSLFADESMAQLSGFRIKYRTDALQQENQEISGRVRVLGWVSGVLGVLLLVVSGALLYYRKKGVKFTHSDGELMPETNQTAPIEQSRQNPVNGSNETMARVVDAIYAGMAGGKCNEEYIAQYLNVSVPHLRDIIVENVNEKPASYILGVRIAYAKRLLKMDDRSVGEIAKRCGFRSIAHFSKAFKQVCNVSPTQYRRMSTLEHE